MHSTSAVLCGLLGCVVVCWGEECRSANSSPVKFTITSEHNQTGHWIANVTVDHADYKGDKSAWRLEVEQHVEQCQDIDSVLLVVTVTAPPRRPGQDFTHVPGLGYYKFHTKAQTWLAARHTCKQERAHLLVVNSDDEFATVKSMWDNYPNLFQDWKNDYVHIGISDLAEEGNFTTMFGESLNMTGYAKWGNGEPSHGKTANCGRLSRTGQLFDSYCTNELAFFCEQ